MPWNENSSTEPRRFKSGSSNSETLFDYAGMKERVAAIEEKMAGPTFWNNQEQAQATVGELKEIRASKNRWTKPSRPPATSK